MIERLPECLTGLMKFLLRQDDITGTRIAKYIELTCNEKKPEKYKPRKGLVNGNLD